MPADTLKDRVLAYSDRHALGVEPFETEIPGLSVSRHRRPTELYPVLYRPIFCLVLQGAKQTSVGEEIVTFAQGRSVIIGLELPTFARVVEASRERPYVALSLDLDIALFKEMTAEIEGVGKDAASTPAITSGGADEAVVDAMTRLFGLIGNPAAASVLSPLILREIHFWLLSAEHGGILRQISLANSPTARIAEAAMQIRRRYTEALRVPDLARDAGMSESTFHQHFRIVCGTTPLQFQKRLRLLEARRLMLAEDKSVTTAALLVGYESPTQFSREFVRLFGVSPKSCRYPRDAATTQQRGVLSM